MIRTRRGFLAGLGALLAAPAIVRASSLMPVKMLAIDYDITDTGFTTENLIIRGYERFLIGWYDPSAVFGTAPYPSSVIRDPATGFIAVDALHPRFAHAELWASPTRDHRLVTPTSTESHDA